MKKILLLIALIPNLALAQGWQIPNPAGTPRALPTPGTVMTKANVDTFGNQQVVSVDGSGSGETQSVIPVSNAVNLNGVGVANVGFALIANDNAEAGSTTTLINATAHSARVGDTIAFTSGAAANIGAWSSVSAVTANTITIANAAPTTIGTGDGFRISRPQPIGSSYSVNYPAMSTFLDSSSQPVVATGILKLEDSAAASGDALVGVAGVYQATLAASAADNDYGTFKLNTLGALWSQPTGGALGGSTTYSKISTADNNSTNIKASAGTVYSIQASNLNATVRYLKLYNKATAPTCGTDTPVFRYAIPPTSAGAPPLTFPVGAAFPLGIGICIVTGITDADNTATAASEQLVNITYN